MMFLVLLVVQRLLQIHSTTEIISLFAGTYNTGFSGDNGPATLASLSQTIYVVAVDTNFVYISDNGNNRVRRVTRSTGIIKTVVGGGTNTSAHHIPATSAVLAGPMGLVLDGSSNLYIATWDNRILYVTVNTNPVNPIVTTIAGNLNGLAGSSGDKGLANYALLNSPFGIAFDSSYTNLYMTLSNAAYNAVRKISITTGIITLIAGGTNVQVSEPLLPLQHHLISYCGTANSATTPRPCHYIALLMILDTCFCTTLSLCSLTHLLTSLMVWFLSAL